ncbi:hypothetical protein GCM10027290_31640 [Micromonospora sonneratiae]|uniref:Condensation domain-containing protein n=1 Tax=Micromonospora sonneratiae TaxID=1184706 RepID=A0ABW3YNK3_9ACTN
MSRPVAVRRASRLQTRLWFFSRLHPGLPFFMIPIVLRLTGEVDPDGIRACLAALMRRHETLRTRLVSGDDGPEQVVDDAPLVLAVTDLSTAEDKQAAWDHLLEQEYADPLDIEQGPLMRARLARLGPTEHMLAVFVHHICVDGPSIEVMLRELGALYAAWETGVSLDDVLEPAPESYERFGHWLDETAAAPAYELSRAYWRAELGGRPAFDPPTDRPRPPRRDFEVHEQRATIPADLAAEIREFARQQRVTPFVVLAAVLGVMLGRRSGPVGDVVIATPWSLRSGPWLRGTVGFFINTVPLRIRMAADSTFRQVLTATRGAFFDAMDHCAVPFDEIVAIANPVRDLSRLPITSVCFQVLGSDNPLLELGSVRAERRFDADGASEFDLVWDVIDPGDGEMTIAAKYTCDIYDSASIRDMADTYLRFLRGALTAPRGPILDIDVPSDGEHARLLALAASTEQIDPRPDVPGLPCHGRLYLLDDAGRLSPIGSVGEVHVEVDDGPGDGLIPDKVTGRAQGWLRRTGVQARWRLDGGLDWYGVPAGGDEPDVADELARHPSVHAAVTVPFGDDLVGYVATTDDALTPAALRGWLLPRIGAARVPAWFVLLDELPLDDTGDLDHQVLDEIAHSVGIGRAQVGNELEETVRGVWQECLGHAVPNLDVSFFDIDGHSLIAVRIAARLQKLLDIPVPVRAIFDTPTVRTMAEWLATAVARAPEQATTPDAPAALAADLAAASDEELAALLRLTGTTTAKDHV